MIMDAISSLPADVAYPPAERSRRISGIQRGALALLLIGR
jgi:hypothetical protein